MRLNLVRVLLCMLLLGNIASAQPVNTGKPARFVRIELPGEKRILTLAEVEVFSGGKNIANSGKATQSSTNGAAVASRAIDGNKNPDFAKQGQTHTSNAGEKNPWWELDLGQAVDVEKIGIWNRKGFENRLDGFTITLLDADATPPFALRDRCAPGDGNGREDRQADLSRLRRKTRKHRRRRWRHNGERRWQKGQEAKGTGARI